MPTVKYNNFVDILDFERTSSGTALTKVSYGPNLVNNGDFSNGTTGWNASSAGSIFYIENNIAVVEALSSDWSRLAPSSNQSYNAGSVYILSFVNEGLNPISIQSWIPAPGNYYNFPPGQHNIIVTSDVNLKNFQFITSSQNQELRISNVSVKEVTFNDPSGTLTLINHPANIPRIEYDENGNIIGLLMEFEKTNLFLHSSNLTYTGWNTNNAAPLLQDTVSPDGNLNAFTFVDDGSTGTADVNFSRFFSPITDNTQYTASIFAKADGNVFLAIRTLFFNAGQDVTWFNLSTGQIGTKGANHDSASIKDYGNGWYRCSITFTSGTGEDNTGAIYYGSCEQNGVWTTTKDGTSSIKVWGAQVEAGTFASSYIPTSSGTVTRTSDSANVPVDRIGYNKEVGTILIEAINNAPDNGSGTGNNVNNLIQLSGGNSNYSSLGIGSTSSRVNRPNISTRSNAGAQYYAGDLASLENTFDEGNVVKFAGLFDTKNGRIAGSVNGSDIFETTGAVVAGIALPFNELQLGFGQGSAHFKNVSYYPYRLTDRQLKQITGATYNLDYRTVEVGTITRTPVATGAELVGYSGFSTTNYLEQPYNSELDFGTGDFCVMGWAKRSGPPGSSIVLISKTTPGTNASPYFEIQPVGEIFWVGNNSTSRLASQTILGSVWTHIAVVRTDGIATLYINGNAEDSSTNTDNYNHNNTDTLRFGCRQDGFIGNGDQIMALWRISATAPTPEQIKKIYEDEKMLFQENAACTLYGSSNAVTAFSYDDSTNLLHVGTSAGRSIFKGLRRVDNTTTPITTAISAKNGLIIEQ